MKYNKLVRDKIPSIIKEKGINSKIHKADNKEYWTKLKEKLHEEVKEFSESEKEEEIADILEVLNAICEHKNFDMNRLEQLRKQKAEERGSFKEQIILDETDD